MVTINLETMFNDKLTYLRDWIKVKILRMKLDTSEIPEGYYCYTYDKEETEKQREEGLISDWTNINKVCPYYKYINKRYIGCSYLQAISDDLLLTDQCKICSEKLND